MTKSDKLIIGVLLIVSILLFARTARNDYLIENTAQLKTKGWTVPNPWDKKGEVKK